MGKAITHIYMNSENLTFTDAIEIFKENLPDILNAYAENMRNDIQVFERSYHWVDDLDDDERELAEVVKEMSFVEQFNEKIKKMERIARVIESERIHAGNSRLVTQDMIDRAKQYPIQDMYVGKLVKRGGDLWGVCPFHKEYTPSFHINTKKNLWYCHGACQSGGDAIKFYQISTMASFPDTIRHLNRV